MPANKNNQIIKEFFCRNQLAITSDSNRVTYKKNKTTDKLSSIGGFMILLSKFGNLSGKQN
jgi:hypothetical protein